MRTEENKWFYQTRPRLQNHKHEKLILNSNVRRMGASKLWIKSRKIQFNLG